MATAQWTLARCRQAWSEWLRQMDSAYASHCMSVLVKRRLAAATRRRAFLLWAAARDWRASRAERRDSLDFAADFSRSGHERTVRIHALRIWRVYLAVNAKAADLRDASQRMHARSALNRWRSRATGLRSQRKDVTAQTRRRLAGALLQLACSGARRRRSVRTARLALRLLLARTLDKWRRLPRRRRRGGLRLRTSDVTSSSPMGCTELELGMWLDAQRFNALGCGLDRWREYAAERRRRKLHGAAASEVRSLLWL